MTTPCLLLTPTLKLNNKYHKVIACCTIALINVLKTGPLSEPKIRPGEFATGSTTGSIRLNRDIITKK